MLSLSNRFNILHTARQCGNDIAMFCAILQNDLTTEMGVMDERVFAWFEFKIIIIGRIAYNQTAARLSETMILNYVLSMVLHSQYFVMLSMIATKM